MRNRIRSVRVDPSLQETRDLRMYDSDSLAQLFGDDPEGEAREATHGVGHGFKGPDGELWHKDRHTGEPVPMSNDDIKRGFLSGPIVDET